MGNAKHSKSGREVMRLFHRLVKEQNRGAVIVSHDKRIKDTGNRVRGWTMTNSI